MDYRGQTAGERPFITRGFVATRLGIEVLIPQLYREAIARGLGQAQQVLVLADGAVWIWNAVQDRFPDALQRLDLWHAAEHLWAVAHELYNRQTPEARAWVPPLLQQVRQDQTPAVIATLEEIKRRLLQAQQEELQKHLWRWARRRHPKKTRQWVKDRDFPHLGSRRWTFAADTGERTPEGERIWLKLVYTKNTKIRRHVLIRGAANPFDPAWRAYFKERAFSLLFGITRKSAEKKSSC